MTVAPKHRERIERLESRLEYQFKERAMALRAITHKSYSNEHPNEGNHNERLEFLGDAVLDLVISATLMDLLPEASEGELTRVRSMLVSEESLANLARRIELGGFLLLGRGLEISGGSAQNSVLADALEAVIGAIYLDAGYDAAANVLRRLASEAIAAAGVDRKGRDYKSLLQVQTQLNSRLAPRYRVVGEHGPDHVKVYDVEVWVGPELLGQASGRSKKEAEQGAARMAYERLTRT